MFDGLGRENVRIIWNIFYFTLVSGGYPGGGGTAFKRRERTVILFVYFRNVERIALFLIECLKESEGDGAVLSRRLNACIDVSFQVSDVFFEVNS